MKNYLIIGAGPAGLTAGLILAEKGEKVVLLEKSQQVGGISRTVVYKKYRFDIGGHRFFTKNQAVLDLWGRVMKKDFLVRNRISRIYYQGKFYNYPLEPVNALFNLGVFKAGWAFLSHLQAKSKPIEPEKNLEDVYINSFGRYLYNKFFRVYSTRLWGLPPAEMAPDWGKARVGKLSLFSAIKDAFFPEKAEIKSLIRKFNYPKLGPGQMWDNFAGKIIKSGGKIRFGAEVERIYHRQGKITAVVTNKGEEKNPLQVISSMPVRDLINCLSPAAPAEVLAAANQLKYRDYILVALVIKAKKIFPDQWIYIQDPGFMNVRVQNVNNWSSAMVGERGRTVLGMEYVVSQGDPLWQMKDRQLIELAKKEAEKLGFTKPGQVVDAKVVRELKVYPVYDLDYQKHLGLVKNYLSSFKNLTLVGRNGMHKYNNMDHSMLTAMLAVENIFGAKHDLWKVNADQEYHERK